MITAVSYCFKYASISFKSLRIVFSEHAKRLDKSCMTNGLASSVNRIRNNSLLFVFSEHVILWLYSCITIGLQAHVIGLCTNPFVSYSLLTCTCFTSLTLLLPLVYQKC